MSLFSGEVRDGFGAVVGAGLVLDDDGVLTRVLDTAANPQQGEHTEETHGAYIIPGLVDVHCHGGGGASFPDDIDAESIAKAIAAHRSGGTTALLASLVSMVDPLPAIAALLPFCRSGELAGIHMEGPFVSPHKAGAQNPAAIRGGDLNELESWLTAGDGWIRTMTVAPETENAAEVAHTLLSYGAKPSWGHTATDGATAAELLRSTVAYAQEIDFFGVPQTATHLFNAMPAIDHREPGPVREFIQAARRGEIAVELIGDGVHLASILVEDVMAYIDEADAHFPEETRGPERTLLSPALAAILVTDAMSAAGMPEGAYQLGGLEVEVKDGAARLAGRQTIAGGCTRLAEQVALLANRGVLDLGQLVRATVAGPAYATSLLRPDRRAAGVTLTFEPGFKPSFIVLDANYRVIEVVREGTVVER
ncbi:amidohydrolase family protein [Actinomycetaceae bacterium L2_0104]